MNIIRLLILSIYMWVVGFFCGLLHSDSLWSDAVLVFLALTIETNAIAVAVFISYRELDNQYKKL